MARAKPKKTPVARRRRAKVATAEPAVDKSQLVLTTMKAAADELRKRIGKGSPRMLRDWLKDGMPGTPGKGTQPGHFPIEEMVVWANDNLNLTEDDEVTKERSRIKTETAAEKLRAIKLKNQSAEAEAAVKVGAALPREEWTLFAQEVVAIFANRQMRLGKRLAQRGVISRDRIKDVEEEVRKDLAGLKEALEAGPPKDSDSD